MKKIILIICLTSLSFAFDLGMINKVRFDSNNPSTKNNKDVKDHVEKLEREGVSHPSENILVGITYEYGIKEANIKSDRGKAIHYYQAASKAGIVYGDIRLAILYASNGLMDEAMERLDYAYFSKKQTIDEDKIILDFEIQLNEEKKDYLKMYYFLMQDVEKYQNSNSQLKLFNLKYYGKGSVLQDLDEAFYYLNEACLNPNKSQTVDFFCKNNIFYEKD